MGFNYVIGTPTCCASFTKHTQLLIEHMEEDEETPKSIPPWVELEYAVCLNSIFVSRLTTHNLCSAYENPGRCRRTCAVHAPLEALMQFS